MSVETAQRPAGTSEQQTNLPNPWDVHDTPFDFDIDTDSGADAPDFEADQPDRFADYSADPTDDEIEQQRQLYELDREQLDRQILGKSIRLREDIRTMGGRAVSRGDSMLARVKNMPGSPRKHFRKMRMERAQTRLANKEQRLQDKVEAWQHKYTDRETALTAKLEAKREKDLAWIEAATSERQRRHRQAKADRKHERRQDKVDSKLNKLQSRHDRHNEKLSGKVDAYRVDKFAARKDRYDATVQLHQDRLDKAGARAETRGNNAAEARKEALARRETAMARKELRRSLRREHSATFRERRAMLNEIFGEGDESVARDQLRALGRRVMERQMTGRDQRESQRHVQPAERAIELKKAKLRRSELLLETLPSVISEKENRLLEADENSNTLKERADALRTDWQNLLAQSEDNLSYMDRAQYLEAIKQADQAADQAEQEAAALRREIEHAHSQLDGLPQSIAGLEADLTLQHDALRQAKAKAAARSGVAETTARDVTGRISDILNGGSPPVRS